MVLPVTLVLTIALIVASTSSAGNRLAQLLFGLPIVAAQEFNLIHLAYLEHDANAAFAAVAWLPVVVILFFTKRNRSSAIKDSVAARIEHERRASEQTALLENAPLGMLVVRDTRIVICNDALLKLFGYASKADLVGRNIRTLMPDDDAWRETRELASAALLGSVTPRVVRRRHANGSVVETMFKIAAVRTGDGEVEFIGIHEDVQEQLAAEETYRDALRMQRLVFESAGEGIAVVKDGVIEQANQALADLLGLSVGQLTNRPLQSIFEDPHSWTEIERHFQRLGTAFKLERRIVRADGRGAWVKRHRKTGRPAGTPFGVCGCGVGGAAALDLGARRPVDPEAEGGGELASRQPRRDDRPAEPPLPAGPAGPGAGVGSTRRSTSRRRRARSRRLQVGQRQLRPPVRRRRPRGSRSAAVDRRARTRHCRPLGR